jgi:hypothetical protein
MKFVLKVLLALMCIGLIACNKPGEIDPTEKYVGNYSVRFETTERNLSNGKIDNRNSQGTLTVSKSTAKNQIIIPYINKWGMDLIDSRFTLLSDIVTITGNGKTYNFERTGFGSFSNNTITVGYIDKGIINGQTIEITTVVKGSK